MDGHGPLDRLEGAADLRAALAQDLAGLGDALRRAVGVPQVRVARGRPERLGRARPADEDREASLDRARLADRVVHPVEAALVRDPLPVEQPPDQADRLVEPVEPLAEPRTEIDPERVVLALEPAATEPEDEAPVREMVDGRRELRGQARVPERVRADEQAEPDALGQDGERRERRPALELGVRRVALVRQQVVVHPEAVPAGALDGQARVAERRPVGAVDPERRPEPQRCRHAWIVVSIRKTGSPGLVGIGEDVGERWRQRLGVGQVPPEDDVLVAEQLGHRVVRGQARRDPLELVVRRDRAERGHEPGLLDRGADPVRLLDERSPEGVDPGLLGEVHAPADVHLAGLEVEVAAVRVGHALGADERPIGTRLEPGERGAQVGLVGRLVLGESRVAVDPEDRVLRIGAQRDAARLEPLGQGRDELLQRHLQQPLVVGLARLEPRPLVVLGELGEEVDGVGREPGERGLGDGHCGLRWSLGCAPRLYAARLTRDHRRRSRR